LNELRRIGIQEPSLRKKYLEGFEHYLGKNYGSRIATAAAEPEKILFKENSFLRLLAHLLEE
jgi:hypothetical protein